MIRNKARGLPANWPSEQDVDVLVHRADGLFIYAATTCRYVLEGMRFAKRRLEIILEASSQLGPAEKHLDVNAFHWLASCEVEAQDSKRWIVFAKGLIVGHSWENRLVC